jgi:hypothetical protein
VKLPFHFEPFFFPANIEVLTTIKRHEHQYAQDE